jgi:mgtE-like transporter
LQHGTHGLIGVSPDTAGAVRRLVVVRTAVRRLLAHWSNERATLRQGVSALTIGGIVTLGAGIILGAMENIIAETPGLLVLVPSAIGMRGAVFGAMAARLGTGMLTGQYTQDLRRGRFTAANIEAGLLQSLITAVFTGALAWGAAGIFGLETIDVLQLIVVSTVGASVASVVVLGVTLLLARTAAQRSWDMDAIGSPVVTATADVIALPALLLGVLVLGNVVVHIVLGGLFIVAAIAAIVIGLRNRVALTRRIMRESLPVLAFSGVMGILAGTLLETRLDTLVADPALLVAVPPFMASAGALGGILSARLSSQLHTGLLQPRTAPDRPAVLEGSLIVLLALVGFTLVSFATLLGAGISGLPAPPAPRLLAAIIAGGMLATLLLSFVAYYAATASYRFGLDPDNSSIPIVTSTMDFLGILCLIVGISAVGLA